MKKARAFTLVELLVVIAIIALLMSILMPALARVRKQAKNVLCQSNLRQWALIFSMYMNDNDGVFPKGYISESDGSGHWINAFRDYYGNEHKIRCCPTATKPLSEGGQHPFAAWGVFGNESWHTPGDYGSYGINRWLYNAPEEFLAIIPDAPALWTWRNAYVKNASKIAMFADCLWQVGTPGHRDLPPVYNGQVANWPRDTMRHFSIDRHNGTLNVALLDFSVREIGLKELWTLKWHRRFPEDGPWTIAGGIEFSDWPKWMRNFKDY